VSRIRHEIQVERENWRSLGKADAMVHTSFAWLEQHLDRAGTRRALIHRDIGMHNILVDASRVTAFLDWECPVIGNPAEDLGYARYTAMQLCEWDEFLAAYSEGGGMIPSREELDFYTLWGLLRVALIIARARAGVVSGQLPDLGLAYVGEHFVQRLLCRVSETLSSLLR
jgi:aminoglycoside phosphotransferase (APT) family kinase protein